MSTFLLGLMFFSGGVFSGAAGFLAIRVLRDPDGADTQADRIAGTLVMASAIVFTISLSAYYPIQ